MKVKIIENKNDLSYQTKYKKDDIICYMGETIKSNIVSDSYFLKNQYYIIKEVHESVFARPGYPHLSYWVYDISPVSKRSGKIFKREMTYQAKAIDEMPFEKIGK